MILSVIGIIEKQYGCVKGSGQCHTVTTYNINVMYLLSRKLECAAALDHLFRPFSSSLCYFDAAVPPWTRSTPVSYKFDPSKLYGYNSVGIHLMMYTAIASRTTYPILSHLLDTLQSKAIAQESTGLLGSFLKRTSTCSC